MGNRLLTSIKHTAALGFLALAVAFSPTSLWAAAKLTSLQALIDAAKPGDTIIPKPGLYAGPLLIDKPLTLDGEGKVTMIAVGWAVSSF